MATPLTNYRPGNWDLLGLLGPFLYSTALIAFKIELNFFFLTTKYMPIQQQMSTFFSGTTRSKAKTFNIWQL